MNDRRERRQEAVARHRIQDPRLAEQEHQNDRTQPKNRAELDDGGEPAKADGIGADRDRVGHVQSVERHDAGNDDADQHIEEGADRERSEDGERHVLLRVAGFLRGGRYGYEADIGKKNPPRAANNPAPAILAGSNIRRNEGTRGIARGHPIRGLDEPDAGEDEKDDDRQLDGDNDVVERGGFLDPYDKQDGEHQDDDDRRKVDQRAG